MGSWVNFADIRKRVSIEDVLLRYYRIDNLKRDGNKLVGPCPVHKGDSPRSFHVDLEKNLWHCFTKCQKGGNQIDLVAAMEDCSIRDAALKLQAVFGAPGEQPRAPEKGPCSEKKEAPPPEKAVPTSDEEVPAENPPLDVKLSLAPDHPHLIQDRGLKVETVQHFGIGYCSRGILRGMIAIPIQDDEGTLVAYAGRRLKAADIKELGKYKFPKGFKKELVLYNFHRAKEHQAEHGLILVEGFFSVVKLYEAGLPNVVASMGCELSDQQVRLLRDAKDVVLLYDGNDAGYAGAVKAKEKLAAHVTVRVVKLQAGTEPESFSPKALRWLLNGMRTLDLEEVSFCIRREPPGSTPAG